MTLTLSLSTTLEERLRNAASQHGSPLDQFAIRILDAGLPSPDRREKSVALLQSWIDDSDEAEQRETGDYLIRAIDEDRLSDRQLFPPELEGKTW